ncbi:high-affinity zinc uptake system ATP-binding protein ZnuC [Clostridium homopropionicum DSM 5847]|uniref:High-affinity zinc uptake system ATP-binding protein ZnuC n=1 Tax=Clostridium homopropionicum DSM 5847 TaxID=1121318 RepID=A0A0L6Z960_9CLOT|nr:metal ABC transporter ATP-binding protein [Clostridium homopropionicum]KOA19511.1 high-affinity zinc uptake system ATP-binding protein ZnuC [Clostridium homopropionicum DSM 5847]SFG92548.1 zinc transport system ATP-binding protein [Clostridium homopropionicum]
MVEIKNMCFSYNGVCPFILNNINLNIKKGDYLSILGENGSGKSTLIKIILKILKPTSGTISIKTDRIGYVSQRFENFNSQFPITVFEVLNFHRKALRIKDIEYVYKSLKFVHMEKFAKELISNLSGGQMQKIFIARALMGEPELIILDEPSTGLDSSSQNDLYKVIKHLNTHLGITIISIEHNLKVALTNSNSILELMDGTGTIHSTKDYSMKFQEVSLNATV